MPLPGGGVATVKLDFEVLRELGEIARSYGLAGAVQHGASTLPDELFHRFPAVETAEIHLATGFQNTLYEHPAFPRELLDRISAWCVVNAADERKPDQTEEQFLYTTRKKAIGPFKRALWDLETKDEILAAQAAKVAFLFTELRVNGSLELVHRYVQPGRGPPAAARGPPGRGRRLTVTDPAPGTPLGGAGQAPLPVRIRLETPADVDGVRAVELAAFPGPEEADIVDRIRREAPEGWQSLVAVGGPGSGLDDLIIGHLLLSPCPVEDGAGERVATVLAIGPVAVVPEVQFRGIGSALMSAAMSLAVARAVPALVLLGHAEYYPRFGFGSARDAGLDPPADAWPDAAWMARLLPAWATRCAAPSATRRRSSPSPDRCA